MLILTRRIGEVLRVGDDINMVILTVHNTQVRIGINAPRNVVIDREEVAERKLRGLNQSVAPGLANDVAPNAAARNTSRNIRVARRRLVPSSAAVPVASPSAPESGKKGTLSLRLPQSKVDRV